MQGLSRPTDQTSARLPWVGECELVVPRALIDSRAWRNLKPPARALFIELCASHDGTNNGRIRLAHREAAFAIRMSLGAAVRAFNELVAVGLIENASRGQRFAARWRLMHLPLDAAGGAPKLRAA